MILVLNQKNNNNIFIQKPTISYYIFPVQLFYKKNYWVILFFVSTVADVTGTMEKLKRT